MKNLIVILSFLGSFQVAAAQHDCPRLVVEGYVSTAKTQHMIGSVKQASSGRCLDLTIDSLGGHPEAVSNLLNTLEKYQASVGAIHCQIVNELKGASLALLSTCNEVTVANDAKIVLAEKYGYYEGPWNAAIYQSKMAKMESIDVALHQKLKSYLKISEAQYLSYMNRPISGQEFSQKLLVMRRNAR